MHLAAFNSIIDETRHWMQAYAEEGGPVEARAATDKVYGTECECSDEFCDISWFISNAMDEMRAIKDADAKLPDDDYVKDRKYKALVTRMLNSQAWAKQRLFFWLENQETNIYDVGETMLNPLKSAHRKWLSFLNQRQHSVAGAGSDERKDAAVKILQCKGLMVSDNVLTEDADGEPLIYAAAADGWALEDLQVWHTRVQQ